MKFRTRKVTVDKATIFAGAQDAFQCMDADGAARLPLAQVEVCGAALAPMPIAIVRDVGSHPIYGVERPKTSGTAMLKGGESAVVQFNDNGSPVRSRSE